MMAASNRSDADSQVRSVALTWASLPGDQSPEGQRTLTAMSLRGDCSSPSTTAVPKPAVGHELPQHRGCCASHWLEFREIYNATWLIERHGFISPTDLRQSWLQPAALAV